MDHAAPAPLTRGIRFDAASGWRRYRVPSALNQRVTIPVRMVLGAGLACTARGANRCNIVNHNQWSVHLRRLSRQRRRP